MKYPIGIQSFDKIIEDGYVYVDKTGLVYRLVKGGTIYFLSRPRRFGKSLLVSTLKCYFQGRKELFKGLAIDRLETEWAEYPVFHIDFNGTNFTESGKLEKFHRIGQVGGYHRRNGQHLGKGIRPYDGVQGYGKTFRLRAAAGPPPARTPLRGTD